MVDRRADARHVRAPREKWPHEARFPPKLRGIFALVLLAAPYVLLFAAGSVWLFQTRLLLGWAGIALACSAAGWYLLRGFWRRLPAPEVKADLAWPPTGLAAWNKVEQLAAKVDQEDVALEQPEELSRSSAA